MSEPRLRITSVQNPRVKEVVRLARRSHRNDDDLFVIEGFREIRRALDNGVTPRALFYAPDWFLGENEGELLRRAAAVGAELVECTREVFQKMAYRDRPEGLIALAPQLRRTLAELRLPPAPLLVVAEAIEKPGNLGTILRSADAAGADAVLVCDRCTDIFNPNVVRASIGTLFSLPVVEVSTDEALPWLRARGIRILAATPAADTLYTGVDLAAATAIVVGTEKVGLSSRWMSEADVRVRIPMRGQIDSLNVASATTILLYEAVRQRGSGRERPSVSSPTRGANDPDGA